MPSRHARLAGVLALITLLLSLSTPGCGRASPDRNARFVGEFSAGKIVLRSEVAGDALAGTIELGDQAFPFTATIRTDKAEGTFTNNGAPFAFSAAPTADGGLAFTTGGVTHRLARVDRTPPNPFADPLVSASGPAAANPLADAQASQSPGAPGAGTTVNPLATAPTAPPPTNPLSQTPAAPIGQPVNPLAAAPAQPVNPLAAPHSPQPAPQTQPTNPLGGASSTPSQGRKVNHPLGLGFEVPSDWQPAIHDGQVYFALPGGQNAGAVYALRADLAPDGVKRADDPRLISTIEAVLLGELQQNGIQAARTAAPRTFDVPGLSVAAVSYEGATNQGTLRLDTYAATGRDLVFVFVGVGMKERLQPTQAAAEAVARSFRLGEPALDQRLAGQWRSTRHGGSGGGYTGGISTTSENNVVLRPDGTYEQQGNFMFNSGAGSGMSEGGVSRGRWAAGDGLLFMAGKDGMSTFTYNLSGDAMEIRTPGGSPQLWERVR